MQAECPWCESRFEAERYGRQKCPVCGAEIELPEPEEPNPLSAEGQGSASATPPSDLGWEQTSTADAWEAAGPASSSPGFEAEGEGALATPPSSGPALEPAPWERMKELGFWRAFAQTWRGAALYPTRFFQGLAPYPSIWPSFFFALLVLGLSSLFSTLWTELFARSLSEDARLLLPGVGPAPGLGLIWIVPSIISSAIGILLFAAVVHLGGLVFGAASKGFATTFRTVCYSLAPGILGILPGAGFFGMIWVYAVLIIGLRFSQGTTAGRAALAALFPFVVLGGLVILGLVAALLLITIV